MINFTFARGITFDLAISVNRKDLVLIVELNRAIIMGGAKAWPQST